MYFNSNGEKVSRARWKEMYNAFKKRKKLVKAGLTSRHILSVPGLSCWTPLMQYPAEGAGAYY
jgi:hypothetical protein